MKDKTALQPGDVIKCKSAEEMVAISNALDKECICNDFIYERDGVKGFWVEIKPADYWGKEFTKRK